MNEKHAQALLALGQAGLSWTQIVQWLQTHGITFQTFLSFLEVLLPFILQMISKGTPLAQIEQWLLAAIIALLGGNPPPPIP